MDNEVIKIIVTAWSEHKVSSEICAILVSYIDKINALKQPLKPCYIHHNRIKCLSSGISSFHKLI